MALSFWWLGLLVLAGFGVAGYRWWAARDSRQTGAPVANVERFRSLPRFREMSAYWWRWTIVSLVSLGLMCIGGLLITSRLAFSSTGDAAQRNRDIMLCLDTSGSMVSVDARMLREFATVAEGLKGERIGLVVWDSSPVVKFPLTNDNAFVAEQLKIGGEEMSSPRNAFNWTVGTDEGRGASLVADGLAACVQRFDRLEDKKRARAIILATDNEVNGDQIYTLDQAVAAAVEHNITIYGIAEDETEHTRRLRQQIDRTGGSFYLIGTAGSAAPVITAIENSEARRLEGAPTRRVADFPYPGFVLLGLGLIGLTGAGWRLRG